MVKSRQDVKATAEWSGVQNLRYRQKPRPKLSSIDRTSMMGIKARMSLRRFVGSKFIWVMEDTESRTASTISETFWWVWNSGQVEVLSAQLSREGRGCPKGRNYQVQITWIFLLESRRMVLSSPCLLQRDILSPSSTQSNEIEMSPGKNC